MSHLPLCEAPRCAQRARKAPVADRTPRAVFSSDCVASYAVNAAARFICWATLFPFSLSLSTFHVSRPQSLLARYPVGSSIVVHHLYPRVCAYREYFSTLHGAGVDEHDFACRGSPEARAFVDEPFVDKHFSRPSTDSEEPPESLLRAQHHRLRVVLAPSCPVFWPQSPPWFRRAIPFGPEHRATLEFARDRSSGLSFLRPRHQRASRRLVCSSLRELRPLMAQDAHTRYLVEVELSRSRQRERHVVT